MRKRPKKTIGRIEEVDFPELGLIGIQGKVDTGAYTSSIDCKSIRIIKKDNQEHVYFELSDIRHPAFHKKKLTWPLTKQTLVKNSFGQTEERYIIKTSIILFDQLFDIELSLADRSRMDYPVLLGRELIKKGFVVDVTRTNCSRKAKKLKAKNENLRIKQE